mmetsp:Transcript_36030/g.62102  ORF Transcript_36030/g.62102 Transcript_36030/m.62102 type:complete len:204 (-) Transcript_36030:37-648(-)
MGKKRHGFQVLHQRHGVVIVLCSGGLIGAAGCVATRLQLRKADITEGFTVNEVQDRFTLHKDFSGLLRHRTAGAERMRHKVTHQCSWDLIQFTNFHAQLSFVVGVVNQSSGQQKEPRNGDKQEDEPRDQQKGDKTHNLALRTANLKGFGCSSRNKAATPSTPPTGLLIAQSIKGCCSPHTNHIRIRHTGLITHRYHSCVLVQL